MAHVTTAPFPHEAGRIAVQPLSLRRNFSWTFVANSGFALANAIVLWLLVKLTDDATVGQFTLAFAIATPLFTFTDLGLRTVQATDSRRVNRFGDYLALRLITSVGGLVLLFAIVQVRGYTGQKAWIILLVGIAKLFESVADIVYGFFQQHERMDRISRSMLLKAAASVLGFALVLLLAADVIWAVASLCVVRLALLLCYDFPAAAAMVAPAVGPPNGSVRHWDVLRPHWHAPVLRRLFTVAFPLGIATVLVVLNVSIPRFAIEEFHGDEVLGIYGPMAYVVFLGQMVVSALGASASPRLSRYFADNQLREFYGLIWKLVVLGAVIGLVMLAGSLILGEWLLARLGKPEYAAHVQVLHWILLAAGIGYVANFLGYGMTATRAFQAFVVPFVGVTLLAAVASWCLVPRFGLYGAAWTTCLVNIGNLFVPLYVLRRLSLERQAGPR